MDVAQMLLCYQEVVQKASCVVSWVPPRGFVVLGRPRISYDQTLALTEMDELVAA